MLYVSMSVKQNLVVSVFVNKCLMVLNDVEYTTFKMFLTKISNYLFVISFQLMFYKTLRCSLARPLSDFRVKYQVKSSQVLDLKTLPIFIPLEISAK